MQTYLRRHPEVELQLHHMNPDDQLAAFDEGMLDLGLSRPLPPERRSHLEEEVVYVDYLTAASVRPTNQKPSTFRRFSHAAPDSASRIAVDSKGAGKNGTAQRPSLPVVSIP